MGTYDTIFGGYIKELRKNKELSLDKVAERIKISLSFLSDIETGRRKPFEADKIEEFARFLLLSEEQKKELYNRAAQYKESIPEDIKDFYIENDDFLRNKVFLALRKTKTGEIPMGKWDELLETKKENEDND